MNCKKLEKLYLGTYLPDIRLFEKVSFKDLEERLPQWIEETLKKAEGEK